MLHNYIKIALRNLRRSPLYSLLNMGGLALGMACCLLIALYVHDEWSYDRFHANYPHIYRLWEKQKQADGLFDVAVTPGPLAPALARDFPEVVQTTRVGRWGGVLTQGKQSLEAEQMLIVDPTFFSLFSFPMRLGNAKTVFRNPDEVIFSEAMAERFFGSTWQKQSLVGQVITFNGKDNLTLVGIVQNSPSRSHIQFDVLLPYKWLEQNDEWSKKWNSNSYHTYVQLRAEATGAPINPAAFADKIRNVLKRYDNGNDKQLFLQPLADIYLRSTFSFESDWGKRSSIGYVRMFIAVGLIVLLIAIVNFINLATARASQRAKEVGVRKVVGAQRGALVGQFLGEAALVTAVAVGLSPLLAEVFLPLFNDIAAKTLTIPYQLPIFWGILLGILLLVSLLAGVYPAFVLSSFKPVRVLKGAMVGHSGRGFRQGLVVGQFALATALIIGTLVIYRQLSFIQNARLGFDKSQLLYVRLKGDLKFNALAFRDQVRQLPGVAQVAVATGNLVDIANSGNVEWEGQAPKDEFLITNLNVDQGFMATTGMSLAAGRNFSAQIPADTSRVLGAYMINETAAKRMGYTATSALGKQVKFWGITGKIVGVLRDFHFRPLRVAIEPFIFRFQPTNPYFNLLVKTRPTHLPRTLAALSNVYKKADPANPLSYGFVDQDLDAQYRSEQRTGRVILYFSVLAILISCLGLFGLAAFTAEIRTKEIGVRKVLGASVGSIVALLSGDFLKLVVVAILVASPLAWWGMNTWLQAFAYKITISWGIFAGAGALAVGIALLTVSFQSVKAAVADPVKSLRSE
ncbi:ABC transporter permease [Fibrella sp. HMF5335]|uniref:ABC transporter permease n=1 Tax=Fibrella rubiginis TaxID=2817060 RepID=A0A939GE80_9BACT|nr:ABC transporter permease [Fibrella rubiginis]MBO0937482.1 ABC transporter permease [Fibrella rubiginis]